MERSDTEKKKTSGPVAGDDPGYLRAVRDAAIEAAQTAMRDTTRLTRLLTVLSEPAPPAALLDRALATLSELFMADVVILLDPAGTGTLVPLAVIGLPEDMVHIPLRGDEGSYVSKAMHSVAPVMISGVGTDPGVDEHLRELGIETAVWLPVAGSRAARGALVLARCRPAPFAHSDADLLKAMAYRIGLALEQAQRSVQLERVVRAGREIARHLDESAVATEAVRVLAEIVPADASALVMMEPVGTVRRLAEFGLDPEWTPTWECLARHLLYDAPRDDSLPYCTADLLAAGEGYPWRPDPRCPVRGLLALPVRRGGKTRGLLFAMRTSGRPFSPDTIPVAMLFAGQTSAALENARLYRAARDDLADRVRAERELRESEERLSLALMGANLGMWDWNISTGEVAFNDRLTEMLDYAPEEAPRNLDEWRGLVHPDDLPLVSEAFKLHLEGGASHYEVEHRLRTHSGRWVWVLDRGKVTHRDDRGRPLRVIGTFLDMTEKKQVEAERLLLEEHKHEVWRAESLTRMAGGIAHHFNNLLGAVMGNLEMALEDLVPGNGELRPSLLQAMNASRRAAEISQLMLSYVGKTTGKKETLDLSEAMREALRLLLTTVPKNVHLRVLLSSPGSVILGDGVHVKQMLTNLISNALEAIGDREGEITVACEDMGAGENPRERFFPPDREPGGRDWVCLSVSDNGGGLEEGTLDKIFDPFFSTKFTGRGLGLSVVLGLVRAHGGTVSVEDRPGQGATFRLYFPKCGAEVPTAKRDGTPVADVSRGEGLVLLVDDEPMIRHMAGVQLGRLGYDVIEAGDGAEATERFHERAKEFRFVLLDLTMPRMGGWETLAALRKERSDIPVILASGYDEAQVMHDSSPERPQAFLHKPYGLRELAAVIGTVMDAPA